MMDRKGLFETWLLTILVLLIVVFYELVAEFNFSNLFYWARSLIVMAVLAFTFYIVYTKDNKRSAHRENWYADELRRRDRVIDELKMSNDLLMKTSLRQSENAAKWSDYAKRLERQK